jgi:hypothetical protein
VQNIRPPLPSKVNVPRAQPATRPPVAGGPSAAPGIESHVRSRTMQRQLRRGNDWDAGRYRGLSEAIVKPILDMISRLRAVNRGIAGGW